VPNEPKKRCKLTYPQHRLRPVDLLDFWELRRFTADLNDCGLHDDDFTALQVVIMSCPDGGKLIKGTGGLRKLRFAPLRWGTGKSGAARVCYVYFEDYSLVVLVRIYGKSVKDDLSDAEKADIRKWIKRIEDGLSKGPVR
jgi:hypothetical protein